VSPRFDLLVRNGTLVIPGVGTVAADVGICGSRIAAIGDELSGSAQEVLDAGGKVVLPGIFDPHVHIGNELSFELEAQSETRAAILGGVTTIGIMLRSLDDSYFLHLPAFRRAMDETSYVDSVFHLQIFTEQQIAEIPGYAEQFGIRSFKFYMSGIPGIVKSVSHRRRSLRRLQASRVDRRRRGRLRALRDRRADRAGARRARRA
jgi:dihydroorotase-like cyclic amidohydrolase